MKASALLILLLLPSLALAQQQYYGTIASTVRLAGPADPADSARLKIHPQDIITAGNIRDSIQGLYDSGRYRTIDVDAVAGPAGTQVTFIVTLQYYFSSYRLEPDNLLARPLTSYFPPPLGKKFSTAVVDRLVKDTVDLLRESGYFNATVTPTYVDDTRYLRSIVLKAETRNSPAKIQSIQIRGGENVLSESDLLDALKVSKGDEFSAANIDKGIVRIRKRIIDKGYLTAKILIEPQYVPATNEVVLAVEIDPGKTTSLKISDVAGANLDIPETQLRMLIPVYEEGTVDADLLEEGRQHLVEYFQQQGFFDTSAVVSTNEPTDQSVHVEYVVTRGEQHRVQSIRIEGNTFFTAEEILKKMKNREGKSGTSGFFSPDLLKSDINAIQVMYQNAGFRSTEITLSQQESSDHNINVTLKVHEGQRSILGEILFTGNQAFSEPELWKASGIQTDQIYSAAIIDNARDALAAFYYINGFPNIIIDTHVEAESIYNTISVRFDLTEGAQYQIRRILVSGNARTAEKVITRVAELNFNDHFNPAKILEAQQKLYSLGIFNRVDIVAIDQDIGPYKDILIQVEESKPILLTPGFGFTELEGPRATFEVSHNNLFGLNRSVSLRLRGGRRERQFQTSYSDPRLFNHDIQGIGSLSIEKTQRRFFDANTVDLSLQFVRKISQVESLALSISYETVNLQDIKVNPNARRFPDAVGTIQIARIGASLVANHRDNAIDPTHGTFRTTSFQVANKGLGSEVNFISFFTQNSYYTRIKGGVVAASGRIGWNQPYGGDNELPISERFFAGGSTTLRGFKLDAAGPPGGGQLMTIGNLEYRIPLKFLPIGGFGVAAFYDTGNVFEQPSNFALNLFTHTLGTGLRYNTPLGPLRVDVGFNLRAKPTDQKYRAFFTLGHAF